MPEETFTVHEHLDALDREAWRIGDDLTQVQNMLITAMARIGLSIKAHRIAIERCKDAVIDREAK